MPKITDQELDPSLIAKMQLNKLTLDTGYTAGISGQNLNTLTASGFYYGNNLVNAPITVSYLRVWVMMSSATSGMQIAYDNNGRSWVRNMTNGTWGTWVSQMNDVKVQTGRVNVVPSAPNTPTSVTVTFPKPFYNKPTVILTPVTTLPGTQVLGVGVMDESETGFTVWLTRTNTTSTGVNWVATDTL